MTRHHLPPTGDRRRLLRRDERGASAVEFALVLIPLVFVLYGLIAFGMMFALKQSMTGAASDAARSVIGVTDNTSTPDDERVLAAKSTLSDRLSWLGTKYSAADSPAPTVGPCVNNAAKTCVTVTVRYPYSSKPLVPPAPGLGLITPSTINSQATVQLS